LGPQPEEGVYYQSVSSPIGEIWIACSERGLLKIDLSTSEERFLAGLRRLTTSKPVRDESRFSRVERMLGEYFNGMRIDFDIPLDMKGTGFQREVWRAIGRIPYGRLSSYGRIAEEIGKPGAVRAVGNAVGANPLPIVVPCHRVIRGDGGLGGYGGGVDLKLYLLSLEGVVEMGRGWSKRRARMILEGVDDFRAHHRNSDHKGHWLGRLPRSF
jgi:O-6-methylguanine DNA methyltransferase